MDKAVDLFTNAVRLILKGIKVFLELFEIPFFFAVSLGYVLIFVAALIFFKIASFLVCLMTG
jgi:hypothetical protein